MSGTRKHSSEFTIPPGQERDVFAVIARQHDALMAELGKVAQATRDRLAQMDDRLRALESAAVNVRSLKVSVDELTSRVIAVLARDADQEHRLGALEASARLAGGAAGGTAGKKWGALAATLGVAIAALLEHLLGGP